MLSMIWLTEILFCCSNAILADNKDSRTIGNFSLHDILDTSLLNFFGPELGAVVVEANETMLKNTTETLSTSVRTTEKNVEASFNRSSNFGLEVSMNDREKVEYYFNKYFVTERSISEIETFNIKSSTEKPLSTQLNYQQLPLMQNLLPVQKIFSTVTRIVYTTVRNTIHPTCLKIQNAYTICQSAIVPSSVPSFVLQKYLQTSFPGENKLAINPTPIEGIISTKTSSLMIDFYRKNPFLYYEENPFPEQNNLNKMLQRTPELFPNSPEPQLSKIIVNPSSNFNLKTEYLTNTNVLTRTLNVINNDKTVIITQNCFPVIPTIPNCSPESLPVESGEPFYNGDWIKL